MSLFLALILTTAASHTPVKFTDSCRSWIYFPPPPNLRLNVSTVIAQTFASLYPKLQNMGSRCALR